MPMNPDGSGSCDRCSQREESTSILLFLAVSDIDADGRPLVRYYCRRNQCSNAIRAAGTGSAPDPQTTDNGTSSNQAMSDGTLPTPDPVLTPSDEAEAPTEDPHDDASTDAGNGSGPEPGDREPAAATRRRTAAGRSAGSGAGSDERDAGADA